jgi:hypothetical protein
MVERRIIAATGKMEISIRRVAKQSTLSGVGFTDGELVECILYRSDEGVLERADLRGEEWADWKAPGEVFCRWRHRYKISQDSDSDAERRSLATAEEIFLGLLEEAGADPSEDKLKREQLILLNLIALMLERRRVLKPLSAPGHYRYMPEKRDLRLPLIELEPLEIAGLISELDALL